jgi:predicted PurR-regulated permease PerM
MSSSAPRSSEETITTWTRRFLIALTILAWLGIAAMVILGLHLIGGVLLLYSIAALLAFVLYPVAKALGRVLGRRVAALVVMLVTVLSAGALVYLLGATLIEQAGALANQLAFLTQPDAIQQLPWLAHLLERFGVNSADVRLPIADWLGQAVGGYGNIAAALGGVAIALINIVAAITIMTYLLMDGARMIFWLRASTPMVYRPSINFLLDTLNDKLGGFLRGQLLVVVIITVLIGIGAYLIGLPYLAVFIAIVFISEFVPVLGGYVAGTIGVLFGFSHSIAMGLNMIAFTSIMFGMVEGQILIPRITGRAVHVHPLWVLAGLLIGAELFGLPGAIFAPIVTGVLDVLVRALWAKYRYLHPEEFPHTPEPEPPPPLIPGVAPTDPEAFLPEVLAEAAGVIERKADNHSEENGA